MLNWIKNVLGMQLCRTLRTRRRMEKSRRGHLTVRRKSTPLAVESLEDRCVASTTPVGLTPSQVQNAYAFDRIGFLQGHYNDAGKGQTIAIIDPGTDANIVGDANAFSAQFGLPQFNMMGGPTLTIATPEGDPNFVLPGLNQTSQNWHEEISLDVEWAHAMAPAANITLVEAPNDTRLFTAAQWAAQQSGVSVVSMSFGSNTVSLSGIPTGDAGNTSLDHYFTTPVGHAGVTFVASSGDTGVPSYPATSPNVLAVGGTVLTPNSSNTGWNETYWDNGSVGTFGTGGRGMSSFETRPAYQVNVQKTPRRTVPDVSYNAGSAFAVYDSLDFPDSPWIGEEGTSEGSPQWAALIAITNQARAIQGFPCLDGSTQTLPLLYNLPGRDFNQVPSAYNLGLFGTGYDPATGLGTPIAANIVTDLSQPFTVSAAGLFQLRQGNLWQYNASGWRLFNPTVQSFAVGPEGNLYVLYASGELDRWTAAGGANIIDFGVKSIAVAGPGMVYELFASGELDRYTIGVGRYLIDYNVQSFARASSGIYELFAGGELGQRIIGVGYYHLDYNVQSFALGQFGVIYEQYTNGDLARYTTGPNTPFAHNVQSFALADGGSTIYALSTRGELDRYAANGSPLSLVSQNVKSFAVAGPGMVYVLLTSGELDRNTVGYSSAVVDYNVQSFALADAGSSIFEQFTSGALYQHMVGAGYHFIDYVKSFAVAAPGMIYELFSNGDLYRNALNGSAPYLVDNNLQSFAPTDAPCAIFEHHASGELDRFTLGVGRYVVGYNIKSYAVVGTTKVYELFNSGELDRYTIGVGRYLIDYSVQSFAVTGPSTVYEQFIGGALACFTIGVSRVPLNNSVIGPGNLSVDVLDGNGNLWQINGSGWSLLDQNVQSIWLVNGGSTLDAQEIGGTIRQFKA